MIFVLPFCCLPNSNCNPIWMQEKNVKQNKTKTMYSFKHAENWSIFSFESLPKKKLSVDHFRSFPHHLSSSLALCDWCTAIRKIQFFASKFHQYNSNLIVLFVDAVDWWYKFSANLDRSISFPLATNCAVNMRSKWLVLGFYFHFGS